MNGCRRQSISAAIAWQQLHPGICFRVILASANFLSREIGGLVKVMAMLSNTPWRGCKMPPNDTKKGMRVKSQKDMKTTEDKISQPSEALMTLSAELDGCRKAIDYCLGL